MALILILEGEELLRGVLEQQLQRAGHMVHAASSLAEATTHLDHHQPDVLLLDLGLPDGSGLDFYESNRERLATTAVVVMTAVGNVEEAVRAMKLGALDFLTKPVDRTELVDLINRSIAHKEEQLEVQAARRVRERDLSQEVIAESPTFLRVIRVTDQVAASEIHTILIQGETGSGKNLLAHHVHAKSPRSQRPLLEVSCANIPEQLLESELFGHEKGAFTDAKGAKQGSFELADGGTVVLDEIGELCLDLQAKLLHFLEERWFRRVGGTREIHVDVRVIALTNRDLAAMVRAGTFRSDLYYRLSVFPLLVPPLRERPEDVVALARYFLQTLQPKLGRRFRGLTRDAENLLLRYSWPGGVRELRNVVERAMVLERESWLTPHALTLDCFGETGPGATPAPLPQRAEGTPAFDPPAAPRKGIPRGMVPLEELEREIVIRAMRACGQNQTRAAEVLGITRDQLRYRLKKFDLHEHQEATPA